jgi:hypothetical protein
MLNGKGAPTDIAHLNCISGYMHERKMLDLLRGAGLLIAEDGGANGKEIVAPFDSRFRGHIDAVARDGSLIEIKSFRGDDYARITRAEPAAIPPEYLWQVNAYMRYGNFREGLMVLVCRDPFTFWMVTLKRDDALGRLIEEKAKRILAAVDAGIEPRCECHRCENAIRYDPTRAAHRPSGARAASAPTARDS